MGLDSVIEMKTQSKDSEVNTKFYPSRIFTRVLIDHSENGTQSFISKICRNTLASLDPITNSNTYDIYNKINDGENVNEYDIDESWVSIKLFLTALKKLSLSLQERKTEILSILDDYLINFSSYFVSEDEGIHNHTIESDFEKELSSIREYFETVDESRIIRIWYF